MKKRIAVALVSVTVLLFITGGILNRFAPAAVFQLLYPTQPYSTEKSEPFTTKIQKGDYVVLGEYLEDAVVWKCIFCDKTPVLQSNQILDFLPYDEDSADWETSDLRQYLNSGESLRFGESSKWLKGEVTLLTTKECKKLPAAERTKSPTIKAIERCDTRFLILRKTVWYWTRSGISTNSLSVAAVTQRGTFYKSPAFDPTMGVCPVVSLNAKSITVYGGNGTAQQPYLLSEVVK